MRSESEIRKAHAIIKRLLDGDPDHAATECVLGALAWVLGEEDDGGFTQVLEQESLPRLRLLGDSPIQ